MNYINEYEKIDNVMIKCGENLFLPEELIELKDIIFTVDMNFLFPYNFTFVFDNLAIACESKLKNVFSLFKIGDKTEKILSNNDLIVFLSNGFVKYKQNKLWYLLNKNGNKVVQNGYSKIFDFSHNYFKVKDNNKIGIIDEFGKSIIPFQYDNIIIIPNDLFAVKNKNYWFIINNKNQKIDERLYKEIRYNSNGLIWFKSFKNNLWGYCVNYSKNNNIEYKYKSIDFSNKEYTRAKLNKSWEFINNKGEVIENPIINLASNITANGFESYNDNHHVFINLDNYSTFPISSDEIIKLNTFLYAIKTNKIYFINNNTKEIIVKYFDDIIAISDKIMGLKEGKYWDLYDFDFNRFGEYLLEIKKLNDNLFLVKNIDGKYGVINGEGTYIIPAIYDDLKLTYNSFIGKINNISNIISINGDIINYSNKKLIDDNSSKLEHTNFISPTNYGYLDSMENIRLLPIIYKYGIKNNENNNVEWYINKYFRNQSYDNLTNYIKVYSKK